MVRQGIQNNLLTRNPLIKNFWLETDFHSPIFTSELVHYTFIRNSGYKEQIFMVPMSSLKADFYGEGV